MAKVKPVFSMTSYGIYSTWDEREKALPRVQSFTTDVNAELEIEFGYIINVKKGKGIKLSFFVYHPDVPDEHGNVMATFEGDVYVKNNDWDFYLGDTLWEPISNKLGNWRFVIKYGDKIVADKTFDICDSEMSYADEYHLYTALRKKNKQRK